MDENNNLSNRLCNKHLESTGKVYLIGAGPGDYRLITLKAVECIEKADVIIYDRLINKRLLKLRKKEAELIYVGKECNNHVVSQDEINKLLVKYALEGKIVARVKGGDPFVFGRGAEEAYYLKDNSISFEIVPGVTSAVAVPAYAGIPVTHRDYSSSFHVITGHETANKCGTYLNYEILAKLKGTIIFLMGVNNASNISKNLIFHGKKASTPVAIIENGTTLHQRVFKGTLDTISNIITSNNIKTPSIIVVGDVVNFEKNLNWFSIKPLYGKNIIVTRPTNQATSLINKIEDLGGNVIGLPTIKIVPLEDYELVDRQFLDLANYNWIIFTSENGVRLFFERLRIKGIDIRILKDIKIATIGDTTKKELNKLGLNVDFVPKEFTNNALLEGILNVINEEEKVLLPRGNMSSSNLVTSLINHNIECNEMIIYNTVCSDIQKEDLVNELNKLKIDFITFTSSSTVKNFVSILEKQNINSIFNTKAVCIGPVTASVAKELGFTNVSSAYIYNEDGLIDKLLELRES